MRRRSAENLRELSENIEVNSFGRWGPGAYVLPNDGGETGPSCIS